MPTTTNACCWLGDRNLSKSIPIWFSLVSADGRGSESTSHGAVPTLTLFWHQSGSDGPWHQCSTLAQIGHRYSRPLGATCHERLATLIDKDVGPLGPVSLLLPLQQLEAVHLIPLQVMNAISAALEPSVRSVHPGDRAGCPQARLTTCPSRPRSGAP